MMLKTLLKDRISAVWLALIIATLASWMLGVGHEVSAHVAAVGIIAIAMIKVHFVGRYFMELRHAPLALRAVFEGWIVAVSCLLIGMYLFA